MYLKTHNVRVCIASYCTYFRIWNEWLCVLQIMLSDLCWYMLFLWCWFKKKINLRPINLWPQNMSKDLVIDTQHKSKYFVMDVQHIPKCLVIGLQPILNCSFTAPPPPTHPVYMPCMYWSHIIVDPSFTVTYNRIIAYITGS